MGVYQVVSNYQPVGSEIFGLTYVLKLKTLNLNTHEYQSTHNIDLKLYDHKLLFQKNLRRKFSKNKL